MRANRLAFKREWGRERRRVRKKMRHVNLACYLIFLLLVLPTRPKLAPLQTDTGYGLSSFGDSRFLINVFLRRLSMLCICLYVIYSVFCSYHTRTFDNFYLLCPIWIFQKYQFYTIMNKKKNWQYNNILHTSLIG